MTHPLRGKNAIVGIGEAGMGEAPGFPAKEPLVQSVRAALAEEAIDLSYIDRAFSATGFAGVYSINLP